MIEGLKADWEDWQAYWRAGKIIAGMREVIRFRDRCNRGNWNSDCKPFVLLRLDNRVETGGLLRAPLIWSVDPTDPQQVADGVLASVYLQGVMENEPQRLQEALEEVIQTLGRK